jgi:hypothetical protein
MISIFVDETGDNKLKDYFGISVAVINSNFYCRVKSDFQNILKKSSWDDQIEFKGSYLFSSSKGDKSVDIDERIDICSELLKLNVSKHNARMKFYYFVEEKCSDSKATYLKYLPKLISKSLPKAVKKSGKNLVALNCDRRDGISLDEIRKVILPVLTEKGYVLFEDIVLVNSGFNTVGILYADLVGYLFARVDIISNDSELFENLTEAEKAENGKYLKLKSSNNLLKLIKNFKAYEVKSN